MKSLSTLLALSAALTPAIAQRVLPVSFARSTQRQSGTTTQKRATFSQELNNNLTGGGYYAQVSVGTPPQAVELILDTGSSDVWILDNNANLCSSDKLQYYYGYCLSTYNPDDSSTYEIVSDDSFSISYVDGSGAEGDYIKDTLSIGGANITSLQMGLAENTTINSGLLGVGFAANVASSKPYDNIMDLFVDQDLIPSQSYSLYLDDLRAETGTILFGGLDTKKFIGKLKTVDIQADEDTGDYTSFAVELSSMYTTADNGTIKNYTSTSIPVILDSGTTLTYLPTSIANRIFDAFGAYDDSSYTGLVYIDCGYLTNNPDLTFDFQFGGTSGPIIKVPVDEMVLDNVKGYQEIGLDVPSDLPFDDVCSFGIQSNSGYYLLGDTFLRSAYVVYDLTNKKIGLAQSNLNATETDIVEITKESGIPDVTGVASQVAYTETATSNPTVTVTGTGSADDSGNAGTRSVPAANWEAVTVAGLASVFSLVGASLFML
ncbi:aspartic peptidase domain-containing protein [Xylariaceae sp. FL0016]|nr:aspartic peptidase domain-containing protein [Xylariaceae sp. FL0016]